MVSPLEGLTAESVIPSGFERRMVVVVVMLGALMAIIDTSIVNVALPTIKTQLSATVDELSMVVTGFIIAGVLVMPLIGWLNAFLGRKLFFMLALGIFTVASIACGLAWDIESLAVFRVIQGLGGGALVPTAQAIMLESYPREQHGKAMSTFGLGVMAGPALGPVLGGWITTEFSWEWIFLINVPIGILALTLAWHYLHNPDHIEKPKGRFDWWGLATMVIGLVSLQLLLEKGQSLGWFASGWITVLGVLAVLVLGVFVRHELRTQHPIVNLSVLREPLFALSSVIGVAMGFGLFGVLVILPLFMASILHFDAFTIGLVLLPSAIATGLMAPVAGYLSDRFDPRLAIFLGLTASAVSLFMFAGLDASAGYWTVVWPQILRGIGLGLLFVPVTTIAMSSISLREMTGASGLFTLIRQLGGSFGIAILVALLAFLQHWHESSDALSPVQANLTAYGDVFRLSGTIFLLCFIPLFLMRKHGAKRNVLPPETFSAPIE